MNENTRIWREIDAIKRRLRNAVSATGDINLSGGSGATGTIPVHTHGGDGQGGPLVDDKHTEWSQYAEIATPATPDPGFVRIYAKDDGGLAKLFYEESDGTEVGPLGTGGGGGGTFVDSETPAGTVDGSNAAFTLSHTPIAGALHLYKNGLRMRAGSGNDYTLATSTITFEATQIPQTGDVLICDFRY